MVEGQLCAATARAVAQPSRHRYPLPLEVVANHRGVPPGRPGPPGHRQQGGATFVPEHDSRPATTSITPDSRASPQPPSGQSPARHAPPRGGPGAAADSAGGGAAASRRGRDGRTPVTCSITAATRAKVQWSVSKPCPRAPWRNAWSMAASWASDRRGAGPVGPALRSASCPPACHLGVPAADVLAGHTELAGDLGLGVAGGKQRAGLHADAFERLAVFETAGVAAVGGWSHTARLPATPRSCHRNQRASLTEPDWCPWPVTGNRGSQESVAHPGPPVTWPCARRT
jgi:hypothetical protein